MGLPSLLLYMAVKPSISVLAGFVRPGCETTSRDIGYETRKILGQMLLL